MASRHGVHKVDTIGDGASPHPPLPLPKPSSGPRKHLPKLEVAQPAEVAQTHTRLCAYRRRRRLGTLGRAIRQAQVKAAAAVRSAVATADGGSRGAARGRRRAPGGGRDPQRGRD